MKNKNADKLKPENFNESIGEYLYHKGIIYGLELAKNKPEKTIDTLIDIYSAKTNYLDNIVESD